VTEAILEGQIRNEKEEAFSFLLEKGKEKGLLPVNKQQKN
jgi:hypothetical protein